MKYFYVLAIALFIFADNNCSYNYNSSYGYKDSSSSGNSSNSYVKQEAKQQESTVQKQSFEYAQQNFSNFDTKSQRLVSDVVHTLKTTKDPHDYAFNLGIYSALLMTAHALHNPLHAYQTLTAAIQDKKIVQEQALYLEKIFDKAFSTQDNKEYCRQAQAVSNIFINVVAAKLRWQGPETPLLHHFNKPSTISTTGSTQNMQFPMLKSIKEFAVKFSELSTRDKKTVGKLFLSGNIKDALKLVAVGDNKKLNTLNVSASKNDLVLMPHKNILEKKFCDLNLQYFAEKSKIIDHLAGNEFCPAGVVIAVDIATDDYREFAQNSNNPTLVLDVEMVELRRSAIVESLLSDHPQAIKELKSENILK